MLHAHILYENNASYTVCDTWQLSVSLQPENKCALFMNECLSRNTGGEGRGCDPSVESTLLFCSNIHYPNSSRDVGVKYWPVV